MTGHNGGDVVLVSLIFSDETGEAALGSDFKLNNPSDCAISPSGILWTSASSPRHPYSQGH